VFPKRTGRDDSGVFDRDGADELPVVAEAMRAGTEAPKAATKPNEEGISIFWRVFGGTILSIAALVVITLFNNITSTLSELRGDVNKINEYRADLLKKDEFNTRMSSTWERVQGLQSQNNVQNATLTAYRTEMDGIKERLNKQAVDADAVRKDTATQLEAVRKEAGAAADGARREAAAAAEAVKKESLAIEGLKERVLAVEAVKKELAAIEGLKERVNAIASEIRNQREDYVKLRQDADRNQAGDIERKVRDDERHKDLEKALKELQTVVQDCQVRLARMEGQTAPKPSAGPKPPVGRPARPGDADRAGPPKPVKEEEEGDPGQGGK